MTKLKRTYLRYNRMWFGSELPVDMKVTWTRLLPKRCMGIWDPEGGIRLNAGAPGWQLTLLHEMCHAATEDERAKHGPRWVRMMRNLAAQGAFDKIW